MWKTKAKYTPKLALGRKYFYWEVSYFSRAFIFITKVLLILALSNDRGPDHPIPNVTSHLTINEISQCFRILEIACVCICVFKRFEKTFLGYKMFKDSNNMCFQQLHIKINSRKTDEKLRWNQLNEFSHIFCFSFF